MLSKLESCVFNVKILFVCGSTYIIEFVMFDSLTNRSIEPSFLRLGGTDSFLDRLIP